MRGDLLTRSNKIMHIRKKKLVFKLSIGFIILIILVFISYLFLSAIAYQDNYPKIPADSLNRSSCPIGKIKYKGNYPLLVSNLDRDEWIKRKRELICQVKSKDWFNLGKGRKADDIWISLDCSGFLKEIDTEYSSVGKETYTEDDLKPIFLEFIALNSEILGNPDLSEVQFSEDENNKTYIFSIPNQKIGKYIVKNSSIKVRFVDGGITRVSGHWWDINSSEFSEKSLISREELLNNFSYKKIIYSSFSPPNVKQVAVPIDKDKFNIGSVILIDDSICNDKVRKDYCSALRLVYEVKTNDTWKIDIDAVTGEVVDVNTVSGVILMP